MVDHKSLDGKTALRVAAVGGHLEVVEYLMSCNANINYKDLDGRSIVCYCIIRCNDGDSRKEVTQYGIYNQSLNIDTDYHHHDGCHC